MPNHEFDDVDEIGRHSRRMFLAGASLGAMGAWAATWAAWEALSRRSGESPVSALPSPGKFLGIPGEWPGRVVEVNHPGSVSEAKRDRAVVKRMIARGIRDLVGSDDEVQAWRHLFHAGDRVGIKVVPVGQPLSISSYEVVLEVIEGLKSAGVRPRDIMVFERYKDGFMQAGYHRIVPEECHWECSSSGYDNSQLEISGQAKGMPRESRVAGYDPDVYREEPYCDIDPTMHDPKDDRRYRSHLGMIISRKVDKFISIPVLKDHRSAGVTLCLKNLSHGSVNNVARSHVANASLGFGLTEREAGYGTLNQCGQFIPAMVSLPPTRQKAVLQILDGLVATYEGGPGNWNPTFATWEYKSLFFATDPVALDRVGWEIIDKKRVSMGLSPVSQMGLDSDQNFIERLGKKVPTESFHIRQPQHIPLAATLGLGLFDKARIEHRRIDLA